MITDGSFATNCTTILIMTNQHPVYKKFETSTPAKVQKDGQIKTYNNDRLLQIKKEMVKDKRYKRLDLDTIKIIRKHRLNRRDKEEVRRDTNKIKWIQEF